jgi:hypothetical protein
MAVLAFSGSRSNRALWPAVNTICFASLAAPTALSLQRGSSGIGRLWVRTLQHYAPFPHAACAAAHLSRTTAPSCRYTFTTTAHPAAAAAAPRATPAHLPLPRTACARTPLRCLHCLHAAPALHRTLNDVVGEMTFGYWPCAAPPHLPLTQRQLLVVLSMWCRLLVVRGGLVDNNVHSVR